MDIEAFYQSFYQDNIRNNNYIDFIGINVSSDSNAIFVFKIYQHIGTKIERADAFLNLLDNKNMIKDYLMVL